MVASRKGDAKKKAKAARKAASKKYFEEKGALNGSAVPRFSVGKKVVLICVCLALVLSLTLPALSQVGIFG